MTASDRVLLNLFRERLDRLEAGFRQLTELVKAQRQEISGPRDTAAALTPGETASHD